MKKEEILQGVDGRLWMNGEKQGNCVSVEIKVNLEYEEVYIPGDRIKKHRYMGGSIEGTISGHKIDSRFIKLLAEGVKSGKMPKVKLVAKLTDNSGKKGQRVAVEDVQFSELVLMKFEEGNIEEEIPFTGGDFEVIDTI